jgi:hypothetical protein
LLIHSYLFTAVPIFCLPGPAITKPAPSLQPGAGISECGDGKRVSGIYSPDIYEIKHSFPDDGGPMAPAFRACEMDRAALYSVSVHPNWIAMRHAGCPALVLS